MFSSHALFLKSHTDWDKEHSFGDRYTEWNKKTALKIQDGVLVFHYNVLESTNLLGTDFPMKFELFQTGRQYEQDGNWVCQGTGCVKSIGPSSQSPMAQWNQRWLTRAIQRAAPATDGRFGESTRLLQPERVPGCGC
jgi:hypothetical protein